MNTELRFHYAQIGVLLAGTLFAWFTVVTDFVRFYMNEGTLFKVADCVYPNPITTPCFYGAFAFLIALVWSIKLLSRERELLNQAQKKLAFFLVAGNIFAWTNFANLIFHFQALPGGQGVSCSGVPATSPFATPCFYGSTLFGLSLLVTIGFLWFLRRSR